MAKYIVKKGDNLSTIAKNNGVKLKDILSINKIDNPDYIQIGQKINLPDNKSNFKGTNYTQFSDDYDATPKWNKITPNAGNSKTIKSTLSKQVLKTKPASVKQNDETGFLDSMKNKIYETYQDVTTAIDQQTSKKVVAKPKVKIDDSFIDYGYKELGTYKDESFKAGKKDSLLSAMNVFDNDKGFDYIVSPKVKEGKKTFNNVKGVAHFLMDTDITPNQKYTTPYIEKGNNSVKSAQPGKFTPYLGTNPDDYVMYYKNTGNDKINVKYGQLKDKDKYKGYEQIKVRSIPFGDLDFNNKRSAGFAKKASYIGTLDGKQTSIITDPESNDVYGRFSGGSGIFHFKEPKTGKTISVDVSGSVNTIKKVGEELSKKYNVDPKQLQFLYHDMGSYSAKPKSHNGVLSNEQWQNYNVNNKGYSGAALMYPMEFGGMAASDNVDMGYYSNPLKYFAAMGINISDDDCLECGGKVYANNGLNIDSTLNANKNLNWVQRLYQKNTPTIFLPGESHPSTHYMENADDFVYPTIIQNEDGKLEYLGDKAYDYAMKTNTAIKFKTPEEAEYFAKNYKKGKGVLKKFNMGGKITAETIYSMSKQPKVILTPDDIKAETGFNWQKYFPMERDIPMDTISSYNRDIDRFAWKNTLQNLPDIQKQQQIPNQQIDSSYYTTKTPRGYFNVYNKQNQLVGYSMDNKTVIKQEPNFEKGGIIQAWIQKFITGGKVYADGGANPYIDPYAGMTEFNPEAQTNMQSMPFQKLQTQPINQNLNNLQPKQFNTQMQVPLAQSNMPQNIGTNFKTSFDASNDQVNQDNALADSMMGGEGGGKGMDIGNKIGSVASQAMGAVTNFGKAVAKPDTKASAFFNGAGKSLAVTAPLVAIPVVGQAAYAASALIWGFVNMRKKAIELKEKKKMTDYSEYETRNTQSVNQPSYYGQYMAKYGANPKMMEQRVIDDIYSDFDKYMKLT